jgi:hypothetical protein
MGHLGPAFTDALDRGACSPGSARAAIVFIRVNGANRERQIRFAASADFDAGRETARVYH